MTEHKERTVNQPITDPFADGESRPSLSFKDKPIGTTYTGTVAEAPQMLQARDYETGQPAFWPDGNPKMTVVTVLNIGGEEYGLWAPKPSSMFTAIAAAQRAAGAQIAPGGTLSVTFSGEKPNDNPRLNAQKLYVATYQAPDAFAEQAAPAPAAAVQQSAAPTPTAAAPAAPAAGDTPVAKAKALAALGLTAEQIAPQLGLDASVVAILLAS